MEMTALEYVKSKMDEKSLARGVFGFLREFDEIFEEVENSRRWWNDTFVVVNIDGVLIGYDGASTTGDDSPTDKGWEFDENSVCYVEAYEVTEIKYRLKK